ncbi:hypothetical protein BDW68DRAFT_192741 [Aspergillus falconensis]
MPDLRGNRWLHRLCAQSDRLLPGVHVEVLAIGELVPRRLFDNASECTIRDACGECLGFRLRSCMCVGPDDPCCSKLIWNKRGRGEPGEDGTVTYPSDTTIDEGDDYTSWTCDTIMTGEVRCSGGGADIHWCTGKYPMVICYNSTRNTRCDDGHFCEGEDCCDIVV